MPCAKSEIDKNKKSIINSLVTLILLVSFHNLNEIIKLIKVSSKFAMNEERFRVLLSLRVLIILSLLSFIRKIYVLKFELKLMRS